jgi:hypothetical protein
LGERGCSLNQKWIKIKFKTMCKELLQGLLLPISLEKSIKTNGFPRKIL